MKFGKVVLVLYLSLACSYCNELCPTRIRSSECSEFKASTFTEKECSQINFSAYKQHKNDLGHIKLTANADVTDFSVNVTFINIKWKKAYLKLSENEVETPLICRMYSFNNKACVPNELSYFDSCFNPIRYNLKDYSLEYKVETDRSVAYKKLVFTPLPHNHTLDGIQKKSIFSYIDVTNSFDIILHIQALPKSFNITFYKVEVFREKSDREAMLDIRLIQTDGRDHYSFKFITYNDEGSYYFKISVISEACPEDYCKKTLSPKVYVSKRGTPLVIGIVGASFIIPFVLFVFHMMTREYRKQEILESKDKALIIFKAHPDSHKEAVHTLASLIEQTTCTEVLLEPVNLILNKQKEPERWCSDSLLLATHIFYICGVDEFEMDYMTYNYLLEETRKPVQEKDILVLRFPYSSKVVPSFLSKCMIFDLPEDMKILLDVFKSDLSSTLESSTEYLEFCNKVKRFKADFQNVRVPLNMPTIIVTEQLDNDNSSDENPKHPLM